MSDTGKEKEGLLHLLYEELPEMKKLCEVSFSMDMANFEAFFWVLLSGTIGRRGDKIE